jgi:hypothetical protein
MPFAATDAEPPPPPAPEPIMRPSNAVRAGWDAEAIDTSYIGFRPTQKIATIHRQFRVHSGDPD